MAPTDSASARRDRPRPPLSVPVRVEPGAGRDRVGGRHDGPHGPAPVVAVSAPGLPAELRDGGP